MRGRRARTTRVLGDVREHGWLEELTVWELLRRGPPSPPEQRPWQTGVVQLWLAFSQGCSKSWAAALPGGEALLGMQPCQPCLPNAIFSCGKWNRVDTLTDWSDSSTACHALEQGGKAASCPPVGVGRGKTGPGSGPGSQSDRRVPRHRLLAPLATGQNPRTLRNGVLDEALVALVQGCRGDRAIIAERGRDRTREGEGSLGSGNGSECEGDVGRERER